MAHHLPVLELEENTIVVVSNLEPLIIETMALELGGKPDTRHRVDTLEVAKCSEEKQRMKGTPTRKSNTREQMR